MVYAETHCRSATTRSRTIILHCGDETTKDDKEVTLKDTSRVGFEWCFEWANEKYRWYVYILFFLLSYVNDVSEWHKKRIPRHKTSFLHCFLSCIPLGSVRIV